MADKAPPPRRRSQDPPNTPPHNTDFGEILCNIMIFLIFYIAIAAFLFCIFRLFYFPGNHEFRVASATVHQFNTSSQPFVSAAVNFTVEARNPNNFASIFYDPLSAHVSYEGVSIMQPVILPLFSQEPKSTVALSPALAVGARAGEAPAKEEKYGMVGLRLELTGKLRYTTSSSYDVYVACDLQVILKRGFDGQLPLLGSPPGQVIAF